MIGGIWCYLEDWMADKPRFAKAHRKEVAGQYLELGWTLVSKFADGEIDEPYEYVFRWDHQSEPKHVTDPGPYLIVLDHEPQFWFLLRTTSGLLLDVACSHSAFGYSFLMQLNEDEVRGYEAGGHRYLNDLARAVNFSAPGVKGSSSSYKDRNIHRLHADAVTEAVLTWRRSGSGE
jgi:hypothetical protein